MIVERELKRLFEELVSLEQATVTLSGTPITLRIQDNGSKISLATPVYEGGNYIPQSVRRCLLQKVPFKPTSIKTYFQVDEGKYQISLNYLGHLAHFNNRKFCDLLEDFDSLADEWRLFLDEHDKNDLIHVRVK